MGIGAENVILLNEKLGFAAPSSISCPRTLELFGPTFLWSALLENFHRSLSEESLTHPPEEVKVSSPQ
jgi:hypothetical protein